MRKQLHLVGLGLICLSVFVSSCKKSSPEFNLSTPGLTATFGGTTQQYIVPAGFVGTTVNYNSVANGYEANMTTNMIQMQINDTISGTYSLIGGGSGNYLQIVNNGLTYSSLNNNGASAGSINITITGGKATGSFAATVYTASKADSLVVTNGVISTAF